jgi:hypothetical protein
VSNTRTIAAALSFAVSAGAAVAQTPLDRLALRGAIACTSTLTDHPRQYEIFETLRKTFIAIGREHATGETISQAEAATLMKQLENLRLTRFEESMLETCMEREGERVLAWMGSK